MRHDRTSPDEAFEVIGRIDGVEAIAVGRGIRDHARLVRSYGVGRWRKSKGIATVRIRETGEVFRAELHWYEAHGIGVRELKLKRRVE